MTMREDRGAGSSPRARGTARELGQAEPLGRFIPARAGNGSGDARQFPAESVHPRARGERRRDASDPRPIFGSSPRARGTVVR